MEKDELTLEGTPSASTTTFAGLKQTPQLLKEYDNIICDQLQKGVIQRVSAQIGGRTHYLITRRPPSYELSLMPQPEPSLNPFTGQGAFWHHA